MYLPPFWSHSYYTAGATDSGAIGLRGNLQGLAQGGLTMITLSVLLVLVFVPASRRILSSVLWGIFAALGVVFLITKDGGGRRRRGF
jgi:hypothetical protein